MENNIQSIKEESINEFEINKLVVNVHNKIANWHNDEPTNMALKLLSLEIVEDIAGDVFKHLGLEYTQGLKMDEETRKKFNEEKGLNQKNQKNLDKLSDEDLIKELEKRKQGGIL